MSHDLCRDPSLAQPEPTCRGWICVSLYTGQGYALITILTSQFLPCLFAVFLRHGIFFKGLMFNLRPTNEKTSQRLNETGRWLHKVLSLSRVGVPPAWEVLRSAGMWNPGACWGW